MRHCATVNGSIGVSGVVKRPREYRHVHDVVSLMSLECFVFPSVVRRLGGHLSCLIP